MTKSLLQKEMKRMIYEFCGIEKLKKSLDELINECKKEDVQVFENTREYMSNLFMLDHVPVEEHAVEFKMESEAAIKVFNFYAKERNCKVCFFLSVLVRHKLDSVNGVRQIRRSV